MASLVCRPLSLAQKLAWAWLGLLVLVAALAPVLPLPYPPGTPDLAHIAQPPLGPSHHWLGTDPQGRDIMSELVFGARTAVLLTMPAAFLAALLGTLAGGAAGFWGNGLRVNLSYWLMAAGGAWWALRLPWPTAGLLMVTTGLVLEVASRLRRGSPPTVPVPISALVMAAAAALDTIPRLVLVVAMAAGPGVTTASLLVLLTLTTWAHPARLVRAQMLRVRALPFVEAARAAGVPSGQVWLRHALPHALQPLRTALPLSIASLLGLESTLSFLGIGLPPDVASWGRLLGTVRDEPGAWWVFFFPGTCLIITILSLQKLSRRKSINH